MAGDFGIPAAAPEGNYPYHPVSMAISSVPVLVPEDRIDDAIRALKKARGMGDILEHMEEPPEED